MLVGIDAGCLGIKDDRLKVGVYQMAVNLFQELGKIDKTNTYYLYSFYPIDKNLLKSFGKNFKNIVVTPVRGWTKIWLPLQLLKDKPDVFVGLNQSLPLKLPLQIYKSIVVVHDALFEQFHNMYPESFRKLHKETKSATLGADIVIVPSDATKEDIEKYYKVPKEKIVVIPEGVREFRMTNNQRSMTNEKNPYFLFVGALKPLKNISRLLEAFGQMTNKKVKLLIVGGDMWRDKEIDKTFRTLPKNVQDRINFLGVVDDEGLVALYKNAVVFVSPSLSEGFGLTFLEALSFGVPVIGPNTGSVPEVVDDAGILVDPAKVDEICDAMEKILNPKTRVRLANKAKQQAQKFSWSNFAQKFLNLMYN